MASLNQWTWAWVSSGSWWWTGKPGVLQTMGSQIVRHVWASELNWTDFIFLPSSHSLITSSNSFQLITKREEKYIYIVRYPGDTWISDLRGKGNEKSICVSDFHLDIYTVAPENTKNGQLMTWDDNNHPEVKSRTDLHGWYRFPSSKYKNYFWFNVFRLSLMTDYLFKEFCPQNSGKTIP